MKEILIIVVFENDEQEAEQTISNIKKNNALNNFKIVTIRNDKKVIDNLNAIIYNNQKDVIIMQAKAIVYNNNWINKICEYSYIEKDIGVAIPIYNDLISKYIGKNINYPNFSLELERLGYNKNYEISYVNSPCIYIKRSLIVSVGGFRKKLFGNLEKSLHDFYCRSKKSGYKYVLCDALYVNKEEYSCHENGLNEGKDIRNKIEMADILSNGKKNILYYLHQDFRSECENSIGGTQLHVKDLAFGLRKDFNIFILARSNEYIILSIYSNEKEIRYKFFAGDPTELFVFENEKHAKLYNELLKVFKIDMVHVHHTEGLSLDIFYEANKLKIPIILTMHDYFYVCPSIKLVDINGQYCGNDKNTTFCRDCLRQKFSLNSDINYINIWRNKSIAVLNMCSRIIVPSNSAKKIISSYFPEVNSKIYVVEHGSNKYENTNYVNRVKEILNNNKLLFNFDSLFDNPGNYRLIRGWAYLKNKESKDSKIYIKITNSSGKEKIIKTISEERKDIAKTYSNEKYINSGFSIIVPNDDFYSKSLEIKILIENNNTMYESKESKTAICNEKNDYGTFNIAFIGGMSIEKGSELAYQLIKNSDKNINWYVFGGIGDKKLAELNQKNVIKTGWYVREQLPELIQLYSIDLICILPIWPETFCYTISEALLCDIPVLATDIGAVGERVKELNCGWLVPYNSTYVNILEKINEIINNKHIYNMIKSKVKNIQIKNLNSMLNDYKIMYSYFNIDDVKHDYVIDSNIVDMLNKNRVYKV